MKYKVGVVLMISAMVMCTMMSSCEGQVAKVKKVVGLESEEDRVTHLETIVKESNIHMPMQVDESTTITSITIEDKYVVYNASVDEATLNMPTLITGKAELKEQIKSNYAAMADQMREFIDACKDTNHGIAYRYKGNATGEELFVALEINELP